MPSLSKIFRDKMLWRKTLPQSLYQLHFKGGGEPVEQYENVFSNLSLETRNDDNIFWKNLGTEDEYKKTYPSTNGYRTIEFKKPRTTGSIFLDLQTNFNSLSNLKPNTKYTIFVEITNYESELPISENDGGLSLNSTNDSPFIENTYAILSAIGENKIYKRVMTTYADLSNKEVGLRSYVTSLPNTEAFKYDLRIWIVEGDYTSTGDDKDLPFKYANQGLPYYPVNYIESTGSQYIDTGILVNQDYSIECNAMTTGLQVSQYSAPFGSRGFPGDTTQFWLYNTEARYGNLKIPISPALYNQTVVETEMKKYSFNKNSIYKNDIEVATFNKINFNGETSVYISSVNANNAPQLNIAMKFGNFIIKNDSDVIVFKGQPCIVKSTGEVGMWDLVSNKFFGNSGSGNFISPDNSTIIEQLQLLGIKSSGDIETDKSQLNELGIEV